MSGKIKADKPLTKKTWPNAFKEGFDGTPALLFGYVECARVEYPVLEKMAQNAKSLEDLQQKLLAFAQQQKELVFDVSEKSSNSHLARIYGL